MTALICVAMVAGHGVTFLVSRQPEQWTWCLLWLVLARLSERK